MSALNPQKLPPWLKKKIPSADYQAVSNYLEEIHLSTVCKSAKCPNQLECYAKGRATFLLMGPFCTRSCRFCAVENHSPLALDPTEPHKVAEAIKNLKLKHAVITSVTRDDLEDGGATHFAKTVEEVRKTSPNTTIEILVPDFWGDEKAWLIAVNSQPDVFNHNLETVPRLYETIRPKADYDQSLALLDFAKERQPEMLTKSGLMLGLGEEYDEILSVAEDLRSVGVDIITVGQYLKPATARTFPVVRFITPEEFQELENELKNMGFTFVACSPFVRSSYNAEEAFTSI